MRSSDRRTFIIRACAAAALLPLAGRAAAASLPAVTADDPTAQALRYTPDASSVDIAERGGAERRCASCNFFTAGAEASSGPCTLFPGKSVNGAGWCSAWVARTG